MARTLAARRKAWRASAPRDAVWPLVVSVQPQSLHAAMKDHAYSPGDADFTVKCLETTLAWLKEYPR